LIIGGDLNFTVNRSKVWGDTARVDSWQELFLHQIERVGLVDVDPITLKPTWWNNKVGREAMSKRLDRFLVSREGYCNLIV
jgi:hypothetical protein